VLASWQAWLAIRLTCAREALLLVFQTEHLTAQPIDPASSDELRAFAAALRAHLDLPPIPLRRTHTMSTDQPPIDATNQLDPSLSPSELLGSLSGEELGAALVRCGVALPTIRDRLSAHADDLERALYAVHRLRESAGDDAAELRVNLLELREQLTKISATDEELASCIR
jgi:hypothetical protein